MEAFGVAGISGWRQLIGLKYRSGSDGVQQEGRTNDEQRQRAVYAWYW
jgi:hypothetical protein